VPGAVPGCWAGPVLGLSLASRVVDRGLGGVNLLALDSDAVGCPLFPLARIAWQDVHRFFVDQMLNVNVGIICNAHVVHAETSDKKAGSEACLELARAAPRRLSILPRRACRATAPQPCPAL